MEAERERDVKNELQESWDIPVMNTGYKRSDLLRVIGDCHFFNTS